MGSPSLPLDVFHHIVPDLDLSTKRSLRATSSRMKSFMGTYLQHVKVIEEISQLFYAYHFPTSPQWIEVLPRDDEDGSSGHQNYRKNNRRTPHFFMQVQNVEEWEDDFGVKKDVKDVFKVSGWMLLMDNWRWYFDTQNIIAEATEVIKVFESRPSHIEEPPSFYRLGWDRQVIYGDGGDDYLQYPVYVQEDLAVPWKTQCNIVKCLAVLGKKRNDFQPNNVVEDIIDPDLFPFRFERTYKQRMEEDYKFFQATRPDSDLKYLDRSLHSKDFDDPSPYVQLRERYHWIPCEISISRRDHYVRFDSPIHNLPLAENKELYVCIGKIFRAMVPMMQTFGLIDETNPQTTLQVVIKAQSYHIQPGTSYAGRWHTEGATENVIAAGVYYCDIGSDLTGGNLKFRPECAPQPCYDIEADYEAPVHLFWKYDTSSFPKDL
eukprot:TRINITY_DN9668_c0_g1_i1.p1 TRINITY_DN9668_c0_g1~~TRINITY_DN9668_c0_g1_i1.p1  ORF type:complete len:433 (+),score=57.54 TRINITY_DN9668_c0_g1_i1:20-1318(+)